MNSGLLPNDLDCMKAVFAKHAGLEKVVLFGSRALGNYKQGSDVDLALFGKIDFSMVRQIKSALEEHSPLPYFFDIINYQTIENPALKKHIDSFGVQIYP